MSRSNYSFSVSVEGTDADTVVALVGELDMDTVPELESTLDQFIEQGPTEIVLDFSDLSFVDSSGIASLISAQKRLNEQNRCLIIRSPRALVLRVLEVTDLIQFLNVDTSQSVE